MLRSLRSTRALSTPRALVRRCSTLSYAAASRSTAAAVAASRRAAAAAAAVPARTTLSAARAVSVSALARGGNARHMASDATINITVPPLGDSVNDATVAEVRKSVGDAVAMDEIVALMETDKVAVDVRAPEAGAITAVHIAKGSVVKVGDTLMTIAKGAKGKASAAPTDATAAPAAPPKPATPTAAAAAAAPAAPAPVAAAHARKPLIQFRYGRANAAKSSAPAGAAAGAAAGATGAAKYRLPVSVFTADVLSLDVSAPERWTAVPDVARRPALSDALIALIELGGAVDPPAPAKAKGAKGGKKK